MGGLENSVVLVTGASGGTGRVHCHRFAEAGAHVIALDRARAADTLRETADQVRARGKRCVAVLADVRDVESVRVAVDIGVDRLGRLDTIVANAGIHAPGGPAWTISAHDWQRTIDTNLTGVWHTVKAGIGHLATDGGSVVIISSTNGLRGTAGTAHYTASKHALVGLARTLANELGPQRIRVNTVHPGAVGTAMVRNDATYRRLCPDLDNPTEEDAVAVLRGRHLLPVPWVESVDVANAAVFLASEEARYITGSQLVVDAGLIARTT